MLKVPYCTLFLLKILFAFVNQRRGNNSVPFVKAQLTKYSWWVNANFNKILNFMMFISCKVSSITRCVYQQREWRIESPYVYTYTKKRIMQLFSLILGFRLQLPLQKVTFDWLILIEDVNELKQKNDPLKFL